MHIDYNTFYNIGKIHGDFFLANTKLLTILAVGWRKVLWISPKASGRILNVPAEVNWRRQH
jgi:hypothetical protein